MAGLTAFGGTGGGQYNNLSRGIGGYASGFTRAVYGAGLVGGSGGSNSGSGNPGIIPGQLEIWEYSS